MYKISTLLILLSLLCFFSLHAENITLNISTGNITITNSGYTQTGGGSGSLSGSGGSFIITQTDNGQTTGNTITVSRGTHMITLNKINIQKTGSNDCAFAISNSATVSFPSYFCFKAGRSVSVLFTLTKYRLLRENLYLYGKSLLNYCSSKSKNQTDY